MFYDIWNIQHNWGYRMPNASWDIDTGIAQENPSLNVRLNLEHSKEP